MSDGLVEEIARVLNPEVFEPGSEWMSDDVPHDQAEARMYASRIARWLEVTHDPEVSRRAVTHYQQKMGQALLALMPRNPYAIEPRNE